MRKLYLCLSFAAMAVFVACGDSNSAEGADNNESSFDDEKAVVIGSLIDERDGQTYKTVKIGNQVWMAENLNYRYLGPTADLDSSSFCYDDDPAYCETYGRLYTWNASLEVCPAGWHLPDTSEWAALVKVVGDIAGTKLKATSGWHWLDYDGGNGTDAYSFSALPAGFRYHDGGYSNEGYNAVFWSFSVEDAYTMILYYDTYEVVLRNDNLNGAYSVRCLKD